MHSTLLFAMARLTTLITNTISVVPFLIYTAPAPPATELPSLIDIDKICIRRVSLADIFATTVRNLTGQWMNAKHFACSRLFM